MTGALLLWAATVRTKSFDDRLRAASATGAREISLFPIDYKHFTESGLAASEMRGRLADAGIRVSVIDPLTSWIPGSSPPPGTSESDLEFTGFSEAEVFHMAETMGAESINAIESFGANVERERIVDSFAGLCDRARARGLRVSLEFMPFSAIKDLETAWMSFVWPIARMAASPSIRGTIFAVPVMTSCYEPFPAPRFSACSLPMQAPLCRAR